MIPDRTGKAELSPVLKLPSLTILAQATTQHGDSESCIGGSAVTQRVSIDSALVYGDRLLASGGIAKEGCSARTPTLDLLMLWIGVETPPLFSSSASVLPTPVTIVLTPVWQTRAADRTRLPPGLTPFPPTVTGPLVELMLAHWCQRIYRRASSAGLRAYSRNASSVHYSRGGCSPK